MIIFFKFQICGQFVRACSRSVNCKFRDWLLVGPRIHRHYLTSKEQEIQTESGLITNDETQQSNIIANFFKKMFLKKADQYPNIEPTKMQEPFGKEEVTEAVKNMRNGTSPGVDDIRIELVKYAPDEIHEQIANIYNCVAETGKHPLELTHGLIAPLQKPGKKRGPPENLRPITLLSILRKILSVILMKKFRSRMKMRIPLNQAAYQSGRSTTEHTFAMKVAAEKTITSKTEELHVLLLDMSKAFDSINRKKLMQDFEEFLTKDELHLIQIMLKVNLQVKIKNVKSEPFETDTGAPQGDAKSAVEFILYLANSVRKLTHRHEK